MKSNMFVVIFKKVCKGIMILQAQSAFDSLSLMSFSVLVGSPVKDTVLTNDRWCDNGCKCHHGGTFTCTDRYNPGIVCSLAFCFTVYTVFVEHILGLLEVTVLCFCTNCFNLPVPHITQEC